MAAEIDPALSLAVNVISRAAAGEGVELRVMELKKLTPTAHLCHDNVREWVELHPEHKHVRGFLVANVDPDATLVVAHSVVEDTDGTLCDITPSDAKYRYTFVRHPGTLAEFELIAGQEPYTLEVPNQLLRELGIVK